MSDQGDQGDQTDPRPPAVTRPASVLAGPEGHPVHPILVTLPIGAFVSSLVFDLGEQLSNDPATFARGAAWLLVIGLVGAALAALFGLLDLSRIPRGTKARATGLAHLALNSAAAVLFAISAWGRFRTWEPPWETPTWCIALSVAGLALLGASGYLGGQLAYHYGVRVAGPAKLADGYQDASNR